jgi:hypothetical protein
VAILLSMLLVWGIRWTHLGVLVAAGAGGIVAVLRGLPAVGINLLKPYQLQRLLVFLDPERDVSGTGYQLSQSLAPSLTSDHETYRVGFSHEVGGDFSLSLEAQRILYHENEHYVASRSESRAEAKLNMRW